MHGGTQNLEAIDFLRELNAMTHAAFPGTVIIAEESTDWPQVTRPTDMGGLGFSMKWNMGWMHDTLSYVKEDPVHRKFHHNLLTFAMMYAYTENFVLPLSHDEVVHLKRSLLGKMPGDRWQQLANLRLLLHVSVDLPGQEAAVHGRGARAAAGVGFPRVAALAPARRPGERGRAQLVARSEPSSTSACPRCTVTTSSRGGFDWVDCQRRAAFGAQLPAHGGRRPRAGRAELHARAAARLARRRAGAGRYREVLNSDSRHYGGTDVGNLSTVHAQPIAANGRPASVELNLPPLGAVILERKR